MIGVRIYSALGQRFVAESITAAAAYIRSDTCLAFGQDSQVEDIFCNDVAVVIFLYFFVLTGYGALYAAPCEYLAGADGHVRYLAQHLFVHMYGVYTVASR